MEFLDRDKVTFDLPTVSPEMKYQEAPSTLDVIQSSVAMDNPIVNAVTYFTQPKYPDDPNYNPEEDVENKGYEDLYFSRLKYARSVDEARQMRGMVDEEDALRQTFAAATPMQKILGMTSMIASDPTTFVPVGGAALKAYKTGNVIKGVLYTGAVAGVAETVKEGILMNTQYSRTYDEAAYNIGAATLVSGALGGALAGMSAKKLNSIADRLHIQTQAENPNFHRAEDGGSLGAAATPSAEKSFSDYEIQGLTRTKAFIKKLPDWFTDPVIRTSTAIAKETRKVSEELANHTLLKKGHKDQDIINPNTGDVVGKKEAMASDVSIESIKHYYNDKITMEFNDGYRGLYKKYLKRTRGVELNETERLGSNTNGSLTEQEFKEAAGRASNYGDKHAVPEVAELASLHRKAITEPATQKMIEAGIIKEEDVLKSADGSSYFSRVWDKARIQADRVGFHTVNADHIRSERMQEMADLPQKEVEYATKKSKLKFSQKELDVVRKSVQEGLLNPTGEFFTNVVNDYIQRVKINGMPDAAAKSEADMVAQATKKQDAKYFKELAKNLKEWIDDGAFDGVINGLDDVVDDIVENTKVLYGVEIDSDDLKEIIKDDLLQSVKKEIVGASVAKTKKVIDSSIDEAVDASAETFEKSLKAQHARMLKDGLSPQQADEFFTKEMQKIVKAEAKSAAYKISTEATSDMMDNIHKLIDEVADLKALVKRGQRLKKLYGDNDDYGQFEEYIQRTTHELANRVLNSTNGRMDYSGMGAFDGGTGGRQIVQSRPPKTKVGLRGSMRAKVYNIPSDIVDKYVVNDIVSVGHRTVKNTFVDAALIKKYGSTSFEPLKKRVVDDYTQLKMQKVKDTKTGEFRDLTSKELKLLDKEMKRDLKDLEAMHEKLRGTYGKPDDYASFVHSAERSMINMNFGRFMGGNVLASIGDLGKPILVHGFQKSYGTMIEALAKDMDGLKASISEMKELGIGFESSANNLLAADAAIDDIEGFGNALEKYTAKGARLTAKWSAMNVFNRSLRVMTGVVTQNRMMGAILKISDGEKIAQEELANLTSHFIDRRMAGRIAEQFKLHGETRDVVNIANTKIWTDREAAEVFSMAVKKQVDEVITKPGLDVPLWFSRPGWRLLSQFKTFSAASNHRTLLYGLQKADSDVFAGTSAMILLGMTTYGLQQKIRGREVPSIPIWIAKGVDKSGVLGTLGDVNNYIEKMSGGGLGVMPMLGAEPTPTYRQFNDRLSLAGPSADLLNNALNVTQDVASGNIDKGTRESAFSLVPISSIIKTREIFNAANGER